MTDIPILSEPRPATGLLPPVRGDLTTKEIVAAVRLAKRKGLKMQPNAEGLAYIECERCGWPHHGSQIFDVSISRYLTFPHRCAVCYPLGDWNA